MLWLSNTYTDYKEIKSMYKTYCRPGAQDIQKLKALKASASMSAAENPVKRGNK